MRNDIAVGWTISGCFACLSLAAVMALLAACGGTSSSSLEGTTPPPPGVITASGVQLLLGSPQIPSAGSTPVDLTAVVLGTSGQTVSGRTVVFSTQGDSTAFINNISNAGVSDANGLVTAKLNLGSDKTNRTISVNVTVDAATTTVDVDVTGTTVAISGNSSLALNASTTLSISVKDSAGTPLPNTKVTVASQTGNTIALSPASGITDGSGQVSATVTATKSGNDVITASAGGTSRTQALTISSASFGFTTPAAGALIPLNTATPVSVHWTNNGAAVAGQTVSFAAGRGTLSTASVATDAAGNTPGVTIISSAAGAAVISAAGPGGTPAATLNVVFVATSASSVTLQATPQIVQPTTASSSQTNNSSTISAVVRDGVGNLVQNARVNFTITKDPSGGSLSALTAVTDGSGSASVSYLAGLTSSPQNGVVISATVSDINGVPLAPVVGPATVTLTVGGQALFVRLGADNTVGSTGVTYNKAYAAIVTDSAGNPAPVGTTVRFSVRPNRYGKGYYVIFSAGDTFWTRIRTTTCANEDLNFNGIVDPGEDINGNGRVDPGGVASVNSSATSDANGFATATVNYAKDFAYWVEVVLEARAGVVGNDPPATVTFLLPGLATDYNNVQVSPPGFVSPFGPGVAPDDICTNTR